MCIRDRKANSASAVLVFDVKEGKKLYIKEIKIEGLQGIDAGDLKKELALQEHGILSWVTGTGVLREEYLERDSAAITAYAMNHGYVDIQEMCIRDSGKTVRFVPVGFVDSVTGKLTIEEDKILWPGKTSTPPNR